MALKGHCVTEQCLRNKATCTKSPKWPVPCGLSTATTHLNTYNLRQSFIKEMQRKYIQFSITLMKHSIIFLFKPLTMY